MSPKSPIVFFLCRRLSIGSIGRGGLQLRFQPFHFAVRCFGALQQANRELDDFFEADHTLSSTVSITAFSASRAAAARARSASRLSRRWRFVCCRVVSQVRNRSRCSALLSRKKSTIQSAKARVLPARSHCSWKVDF